MQKLSHLIQRLTDYLAELRKIDAMEKNARADLKELTIDGNLNLEDERQLRRVSEAQARLALVPPRRKKVLEYIEHVQELISFATDECNGKWAKFVQTQRKERFDEFIASVLPHWDHNERAARRHFEGESIPRVEELARASFNEFHPEPDAERSLDVARNLVNHICRCCAKFGWTFEGE